MARLDLPDVYRDEDYSESHQLTVEDCILVAEIGSEAWIKQQIAAGKGTDEVDRGCEYELMIPETRVVVRAGFVDRGEAEIAAEAYRDDVGIEVVVVENWRG